MIDSPTIVTALFDIGRDKWKTFNQSYHTYLWWLENTLSLNAKFVIYTEDKFYDDILNIRKKYDPILYNTLVIKKDLNELPAYQRYFNKLDKLMNSEEFKSKIIFDVPEMTKPLYNTLIFNKLDFIKETINKKYFANDIVIWVDAGGLRDNISLYKGVIWPNISKLNNIEEPKSITFFSHQPDFYINDVEKHALSQVRYIQGGSIFCPHNTINDLHKSFNETIVESINNGYIGSEEKMLDITYQKNKTNYNIITCDWREYYDMFK